MYLMSQLVVVVICLAFAGLIGRGLANKSEFVYEMDDRIIEYSSQGKWLIIFYAPWCGHCRKLDLILDDIGKHLQVVNRKTSVQVAKVDATRYVKAAQHFQIRGYPTIRYVSGPDAFNFNGERTVDDIVEFVDRADAPRIGKIFTDAELETACEKIKLFFVLIAREVVKNGSDTDTSEEFSDLANIHFLDTFFYQVHPSQFAKYAHLDESDVPRVAVVKEKEIIIHDPSTGQSLDEFIRMEKFLTFAQISLTNFHNLMNTKKWLVILLVNSADDLKANITVQLKHTFKQFAQSQRLAYHSKFQFGFTENQDLLNGIAIWTLSCPTLFILNSTSYEYSLVDLIDYDDSSLLSVDIEKILNDVENFNLTVYGGQGWLRTLRRPLWEIYRAIIEMFIEAPVISMLIFGFPFSVISIVFYFLCCLDSGEDQMDEGEEGEEDGSETEEELMEQTGAEIAESGVEAKKDK